MRRNACCLTVLCLLTLAGRGLCQSGSYLFSTIAGTAGVVGSADGTNGLASFNFPGGLTVDSSGNLYLADILNQTIRRISPSRTNWIVTTLAGQAGVLGSTDGTNGDALFDRPNGIALDPGGNLFVADHYSHTIRKAASAGTNWIVTTIAGLAGAHGSTDGTNSDARFWSPTGITVGTNGHLYVTDTANFTVRELAPAGTNWIVSTIAGTALNFGFADGTNSDAEFDFPDGITSDRMGRLFVADSGNNEIRELQAEGTNWIVSTIAGSYNAMGSNDGPGLFATFNFPNSICADQTGALYVTDQSNDTIRKLVPSGTNWTVSTIAGVALQAGSADGFGGDVRFKHPWGITADTAGNLYVADYGNQIIRKGVFIPMLRISLSFGRVALSWPADAAGYSLLGSRSLDPNALWSQLTNTPVTNGSTVFIADQPKTATVFYRLEKR